MITEFAFRLNGISLENMLQLDEATINEAALNRYIYAYCQDDHTLALGGIINQKQPITFSEGEAQGVVLYYFDGTIHAAPAAATIPDELGGDKARIAEYSKAMDNGQVILPENSPGQLLQAQWWIRANFPVSEFDIFTGDHLFCRGIVFSADSIQ